MVFLAGDVLRLSIGAYSPVVLHDERIVPIQQRGESIEQGGQLFVLEQSRGDDELTRPVRNQGGIGLDQLLDLRVCAAAILFNIRSIRVSGGRRFSDPVFLLIRDFRSH